MSWGFQIKHGDTWLWICTSSGVRYEYTTQEEADRTAHMCYPDQMRLGDRTTVRVAEIKE